ncbi:hypothetical protein HY995_04140 [Candidatus Micrarchaeota archaeon]|nr:hypothetical protein [Candidatus Micrarchaeota archaeon]
MIREKKRYLLIKFEREGGVAFSADEAKKCLYQAIFSLLGEQGASLARAGLKEFDEKGQLGMVKCTLEPLDRVIAALALKTTFDGKPVALRLLKISGMAGKIAGKRGRLP